MHPLLNIGVRAARKAGDVLLRAMDDIGSITVEEKGVNDFVTQIDRAAENEIIYVIQNAYPNHTILGEESGLLEPAGNQTTWIIDPLDGTTNFLHGFPQYCISIGIMEQKKLTHGIIYDPLRDELFTGTRGNGARLNDKKLRVSGLTNFSRALIGTGFPFRDMEFVESYLHIFRELFPNTAGVRRTGSAALDLAYVAAGRLDGFFEFGLKLWDLAAGAVLIREAGGYVSSFTGDDSFMDNGNILAASPKIYKHLFDVINKHIPG